MCLKALAEIYTMHSFAPFLESITETWGKNGPGQNNPEEVKNERPLSSSSLRSTSAKGGCEEKLTSMKIEYAYDSWSPLLCTFFGIHNRKLGKKEPGQNNPEKAKTRGH